MQDFPRLCAGQRSPIPASLWLRSLIRVRYPIHAAISSTAGRLIMDKRLSALFFGVLSPLALVLLALAASAQPASTTPPDTGCGARVNRCSNSHAHSADNLSG